MFALDIDVSVFLSVYSLLRANSIVLFNGTLVNRDFKSNDANIYSVGTLTFFILLINSFALSTMYSDFSKETIASQGILLIGMLMYLYWK